MTPKRVDSGWSRQRFRALARGGRDLRIAGVSCSMGRTSGFGAPDD